jgi:hypothetical protein
VILAQGGLHPGGSLYLKDGMPKFAHNYLGAITTIASEERLPPGSVTLVRDFADDGGKQGSGGARALVVNGKKVASGRIDDTIPFLFGVETADFGVDPLSPSQPTTKKATTNSEAL